MRTEVAIQKMQNSPRVNVIPWLGSHGYYIRIEIDNDSVFSDDAVSKLINIKESKYHEILVSKFNGFTRPMTGVWFKKEEETAKACEWVESMIVMNALNGGSHE